VTLAVSEQCRLAMVRLLVCRQTSKLGDLGSTENGRFTTFFITPLCGAAAAAADTGVVVMVMTAMLTANRLTYTCVIRRHICYACATAENYALLLSSAEIKIALASTAVFFVRGIVTKTFVK